MSLANRNPLRQGRNGSRSVNAQLVPGTFTVATLPAAADNEGRLVYVSNGAAGSPCAAVSNGTDWLRIALGAAVAAS